MKASLPPGVSSISFGSGNGTTGKGRFDSAQGLEGKLILHNVLFFVTESSADEQRTEIVLEVCAIRFGGDSGSRSKSAYVEKSGGLSVILIDSTSLRLRDMAETGSCSSETVSSRGMLKIAKMTPWTLSVRTTKMVASEGKSRMALMAEF
jgi:hypothetical protein